MEQIYFNAGNDFNCRLYFQMLTGILVAKIKFEVKITKLKAYLTNVQN